MPVARAAWEEDAGVPKLFVAIPSKGGVDIGWALNLAEILRQSPVLYTTCANSAPAVDYARNELVETFLLSSCEWMLWLDTDVFPPLNVISRLLSLKLPVVTGLYRARNVAFVGQSVWPVVAGMLQKTDKGGETSLVHELVDWHPGEVVRVDASGMGCVLMQRKVLEGLTPPWFEYTIKYKWTGKEAQYSREEQVSEDWFFFKKVKQAGFPVHLDTMTICFHQTLANIGADGKVYPGGFK